MCKKNEKAKQAEFYILHFTFYILLILTLVSCSEVTETQKGSLTGTVCLENDTGNPDLDPIDFSGITVSLYNLAELDTTIVRINNEYPQIGVIITQHTEFDHRLQSPIASSTTLADGSFEIEKIHAGTYNLVVQKVGFGFRYICEISISKGDNEISSNKELKRKKKSAVTLSGVEGRQTTESDITLYEEIRLSENDYFGDLTIEPYHHLVIENDVSFAPQSSLTLSPDAIVRINPGCDLKIYGNLNAQGENGHMFWVTSNDGFEEIKNGTGREEHSSLNRDIALYNSMELTPIATVTDNIIERGKWDRGGICLISQCNDLIMQKSIFRYGDIGYQVLGVYLSQCMNIIASNFESGKGLGIYFSLVLEGVISNSIAISSINGIKVKEQSNLEIRNNFCYDNEYGMRLWQCLGLIENNQFVQNIISDLDFMGNYTFNSNSLYIGKNNFLSSIAIRQYPYTTFNLFSNVYIYENNFFSDVWFVYLFSMDTSEIFAQGNYFYNCEDSSDVGELINDFYDDELLVPVNLDNISYTELLNSGIN